MCLVLGAEVKKKEQWIYEGMAYPYHNVKCQMGVSDHVYNSIAKYFVYLLWRSASVV